MIDIPTTEQIKLEDDRVRETWRGGGGMIRSEDRHRVATAISRATYEAAYAELRDTFKTPEADLLHHLQASRLVVQRLRDEKAQLGKQLAASKGHRTRAIRRVAQGRCPCCGKEPTGGMCDKDMPMHLFWKHGVSFDGSKP